VTVTAKRTMTVEARSLSRPHRAALTGAAGLILVEATLELARPWPLQMVVDQGLENRPFPAWAAALEPLGVWQLAALAALVVVLLTLAGAIASTWAAILVGRTAEGIGWTLRSGIVGRLVDQPPAFFRRHRTAELVNRVVSDVYRVEDAVVAWWEVAVPEAVVLLGTLVMLVFIDPWLALTAIAVCPLLTVVIIHRRRLVRRAQGRAREQEGRLSERAQDLIRNIRVVQAFGNQRQARASFDRLNRRSRRANIEALSVEAKLAPVADLILALGAAGVLVLGATRVQQGAMTTGTLLVALTYVAGLYTPLRSLTSLSATLARAEASRDRLREVLLQPGPRPMDGGGAEADGLTGDVSLDAVSFGYDGNEVLSQVDLTFRAGHVTALTGPTGVGKSTVLNLLLRFENPQSGRVVVGGRDLAELSVDSVRRHIAYVPQESWFLDDTIRANIALGDRRASGSDVEEAALFALVTQFSDRLPQGLDSGIGESGLLLSGGERKRLAIARAVVRRADLFLLDEPTAGLDDQAADVVLAAISTATAGHTVIVVTHDPRVARWAEDIQYLTSPAGSVPDLAEPTTTGRR
jgi:ATP-binding cassette subfamily B protein